MKKIGHTGTLDPDAVGVLPVCMGKGTKLVELITDKDKTYEAVLKLGIATDTQDITGTVIRSSEVNVNFHQIEAAIKGYIGEYLQLPPMYSAIKVDGRRLYELARQGKEIERERRKVIIHDIRILDYREEEHEITLSVDCGKGTYIRTLLHDIGETLGCGGTMKSLIRTASGNFRIEDALTLSRIEELVRENSLDAHIIPVDDMFLGFNKVQVLPDFHKLIYNGNAFHPDHIGQRTEEITTAQVRVYDSDDNFIGIYRYDTEDNLYKPVKMFLS